MSRAVSRRRGFGVSVASAIRWQESFEREGRVSAKPRGGDQRSQHIEAHADLIRSLDGGLVNSARRLIVSTRSVKAALCETLERIPARWVVIQHMRERFLCSDCETIAQTPAPSIRSRGVGLGRTS